MSESHSLICSYYGLVVAVVDAQLPTPAYISPWVAEWLAMKTIHGLKASKMYGNMNKAWITFDVGRTFTILVRLPVTSLTLYVRRTFGTTWMYSNPAILCLSGFILFVLAQLCCMVSSLLDIV